MKSGKILFLLLILALTAGCGGGSGGGETPSPPASANAGSTSGNTSGGGSGGAEVPASPGAGATIDTTSGGDLSASDASVHITEPQSYYLQESSTLAAAVSADMLQTGWGVRLVLDRDTPNERVAILTASPYETAFPDVPRGEHTVDAFVVNGSGSPVSGAKTHDQLIRVGVGDCYVTIGDSITYGDSDTYSYDDVSQDGRNSGGGYEPILNDKLTAYRGYPQTVVNEGVSGTRSYDGAAHITDVLTRNPHAKYFLIMYGTNDSASYISPGLGLYPGDPGYPDSYKDYMQRIITAIKNAGKIPIPAKIPMVYGDCPSCSWYPDPYGTYRVYLIQEYNKVLDELVSDNSLPIRGPDFFSYFAAHPEQLYDTTHPNGEGYQSMATLWFNALTQ